MILWPTTETIKPKSQILLLKYIVFSFEWIFLHEKGPSVNLPKRWLALITDDAFVVRLAREEVMITVVCGTVAQVRITLKRRTVMSPYHVWSRSRKHSPRRKFEICSVHISANLEHRSSTPPRNLRRLLHHTSSPYKLYLAILTPITKILWCQELVIIFN